VRYIRDLEKTSWSRRCLLPIGFLVFGAYLAFDVLDLDGSNLPSHISSNTVANLEATQTDAERIFRLDSSTPATSGQTCFFLTPQVWAGFQPSLVHSLTRMAAAHHPQMLARLHVGREATPSSSSSAEPA
jgi:hypothetical protein